MAFLLQRTLVSLPNPNSTSLPRRAAPIPPPPLSLPRLNSPHFHLSFSPPTARAHRPRLSRLLPLAASHSHDDSQPINDSKKAKESDIKVENSQEAWKESLEYFKSEAIKLKAMSEESYEIYSKKATEVLLSLSEKLKIEAEKAQKDLSKIAKEISEEGQEYLARVSENPPESTKELVGVFKESSEVKNIDDVRDYHVGVVYGSYLAIGGFLSFMLTGSIAAVRFGIILGSALVALAIWSKRSYNSGHASVLLFQGQTAIATFIFLREVLIFKKGGSLVTLIRMLISAAAAGFFVYRMVTRGNESKGPTSHPGLED